MAVEIRHPSSLTSSLCWFTLESARDLSLQNVEELFEGSQTQLRLTVPNVLYDCEDTPHTKSNNLERKRGGKEGGERGGEEGGERGGEEGREREGGEREGSKLWESGVREIPDDNMCCIGPGCLLAHYMYSCLTG